MARVRRFPYLLASDESVRVTGWNWKNHAGEWQPMPGMLADWDPATRVSAQAVVQIEPAGLRRDCQLDEASAVLVSLLWHCPGTGLRGRGSRIREVPLDGDGYEFSAGVELSGRLLADRVNLEVNVVLGRRGEGAGRLAAHRPGNLLWAEGKTLILEGQAARFPTELTDFERTGWLMPGSAWYLQWSPEELAMPVLADLRLFVNAAQPVVREAVTGGGEEAEHRIVREMISYDVARTLIEGALENEAFVNAPEQFEDGTVGAAVRRLIRSVFGDEDIGSLAAYYRRERFLFEMRLRDGLRLFEENA